jgi:SagB-type dehydrogenase family enzyme
MYVELSALFHRFTKDRTGGGRVRIPQDRDQYPEAWRTVSYKTYPRFETVPLPAASERGGLFQAIEARVSGRAPACRPFTMRELSALCRYGCGIVSEKEGAYRRAHPSAGTRYPLEFYLALFTDGELPAGLYHYNIREHGLDVLWARAFSAQEIGQLFTYDWVQRASAAVFLTAVFERNQSKYGERGYRQTLIESGAVMQNLSLVPAALKRSCCAMDGVRDEEIERLLDIDGSNESVLCSLVLG